MPVRHSPLFAALAAAVLFACTKSQPDSPPPQPSASASAAPLVSASAAPSAAPSATAEEAASGTASAIASAEPPKKGDGGKTTAAASASSGPAECGTKPLPDCPLQAWMKSNMNPPVMKSDTAALAVTFDKVVAFAPAGYTNWVSIAKDGGTAAKSGDLTAAKAACRTCHDQYKQKYKTEMRSRKI